MQTFVQGHLFIANDPVQQIAQLGKALLGDRREQRLLVGKVMVGRGARDAA